MDKLERKIFSPIKNNICFILKVFLFEKSAKFDAKTQNQIKENRDQ